MSTALSDHSLLHCGLAVQSTTAGPSSWVYIQLHPAWCCYQWELVLITHLNSTNPSDMDAQTGMHTAHSERGLLTETQLHRIIPTLVERPSRGDMASLDAFVRLCY